MKIRISLTSREVEFEGDLASIKENFGAHIEDYLKAIKKEANPPSLQKNPSIQTNPSIVRGSNEVGPITTIVPDSFGEFYSKFPKSLSSVDKILLAGYYLQNLSEGKYFTVREATEILIDQGVSLSNPGAFNKSNISTKRVFKLTGKNFRVSDTGGEYIKSLTHN